MTLRTDAKYMARAVALARRGWYGTPPNPRVGCVLVRAGTIIGEGWHQRAGTAHAEVHALQDAEQRAAGAAGATAYVTLAPCCHHGRTPPCTSALIAAGVARVVIGMQDPNPEAGAQSVATLEAAGLVVLAGVLEADCRALNPGFIKRMTCGRPRVRVKLAMSLDGRTAGADGRSQWITGAAARDDVHRLRAESGAVVTGSGTAISDDPSLTVRLAGEWRQPWCVVLDTTLRLTPEAAMLSQARRVLVLTAVDGGERWEALSACGAELHSLAASDGGVDLGQVLDLLAKQGVNDVLVEAGPSLAGAFLTAGLVDELVVYMAPVLIGDTGRELMALPSLTRFADRHHLSVGDVRAVGEDWRITAHPISERDEASPAA